MPLGRVTRAARGPTGTSRRLCEGSLQGGSTRRSETQRRCKDKDKHFLLNPCGRPEDACGKSWPSLPLPQGTRLLAASASWKRTVCVQKPGGLRLLQRQGAEPARAPGGILRGGGGGARACQGRDRAEVGGAAGLANRHLWSFLGLASTADGRGAEWGSHAPRRPRRVSLRGL